MDNTRTGRWQFSWIELRKTLRDMAVFAFAEFGTQMTSYVAGWNIPPFVGAGLAGLIQGLSRWARDTREKG